MQPGLHSVTVVALVVMVVVVRVLDVVDVVRTAHTQMASLLNLADMAVSHFSGLFFAMQVPALFSKVCVQTRPP